MDSHKFKSGIITNILPKVYQETWHLGIFDWTVWMFPNMFPTCLGILGACNHAISKFILLNHKTPTFTFFNHTLRCIRRSLSCATRSHNAQNITRKQYEEVLTNSNMTLQ